MQNIKDKIDFFINVLTEKGMYVEIIDSSLPMKEVKSLISAIEVLMAKDNKNNEVLLWKIPHANDSAGLMRAIKSGLKGVDIQSVFEVKIYVLEDENGWYFDMISDIQVVGEEKSQIILKADMELETNNEVFIGFIEESFKRLNLFKELLEKQMELNV